MGADISAVASAAGMSRAALQAELAHDTDLGYDAKARMHEILHILTGEKHSDCDCHRPQPALAAVCLVGAAGLLGAHAAPGTTLTPVPAFRTPLQSKRLLYACEALAVNGTADTAHVHAHSHRRSLHASSALPGEPDPTSTAMAFKLHSRPGASKIVLLDFDGGCRCCARWACCDRSCMLRGQAPATSASSFAMVHAASAAFMRQHRALQRCTTLCRSRARPWPCTEGHVTTGKVWNNAFTGGAAINTPPVSRAGQVFCSPAECGS